MKIRYMSDLHLEFETYSKGEIVFPNTYFSVPEQEDDAETILILAGDIGLIEKKHTYVHFFDKVSKQFKAVIYVPGNHEYFHGVLDTGVRKLRENLQDMNVHVLDNDSVRIDGQLFVGATMWTDFKNENPSIMIQAVGFMADYDVIRAINENGSHLKLRPDRILAEHKKSIAYLHETLANSNGAVVVTHHLPSFQSVNVDKWGYDFSNFYYFSDLDEMAYEYKPKLWFHGHTHDNCDYMIDETRVLCNPRGYIGHQLNYSFDPYAFAIV